MNIEQVFDDYIVNVIYGWGFYEEIPKDAIVEVLCAEGLEFTNDDVDKLYELTKKTQTELRCEDKDENLNELYESISELINDSLCSANLTDTDIGKVLVRLAASYFNSDDSTRC